MLETLELLSCYLPGCILTYISYYILNFVIIRLPFISFNMKFKLSTVVVQYMALVEIMTVVVNRFVSGEVGVDGGR